MAEAEAQAQAGRARRFRQAAFAYLHVAILYEAAAYVMWREGLLPTAHGPAWIWLIAGAAIGLLIAWGLWTWHNLWFARAVWALHMLRLPALIEGGFFRGPDAAIPPSFYIVALVVVVANLIMLSRAGWEL